MQNDYNDNNGNRNTSNNQQQQRKSVYQNVLQKRASILIRRQSVVENSDKDNKKSKESEGGNESSEGNGEHDYGLKHIDITTAISIIQLLRERGHDVNAFVRSAALRTLNLLCEEGRIPLSEYVLVTKMALERVRDKAVLVRKNAVAVGNRITWNEQNHNK